jgi:hypothetical protein
MNHFFGQINSIRLERKQKIKDANLALVEDSSSCIWSSLLASAFKHTTA